MNDGNLLIFLLIMIVNLIHFFTDEKMMEDFGREHQGKLYRLLTVLPTWMLILAWIGIGFPLPMFYIVLYLLRGIRVLSTAKDRTRGFFLLNLPFPYMIGIQMLFIGIIALLEHISMKNLLDDLLYRGISVSFILFASIGMNILILRKKQMQMIFDIAADSEEVRSFKTFVLAAVAYSLMDSILCFADPAPFYPPLFLIGSNLLLQFFLFQFISHVYSILRDRWMEERYLRVHKVEAQYEQKNQQLRDLVYTDELTGIFSRRYALEKMRELIGAGAGFSVVFIDLDRLKMINDQGGHAEGDKYLKNFAALLGSFLREESTFARIGGDEFLILMPDYQRNQAIEYMNGIREKLESDHRWAHPFSFSFGVASAEAGRGVELENLLWRADKDMYEDKQRLKQA